MLDARCVYGEFRYAICVHTGIQALNVVVASNRIDISIVFGGVYTGIHTFCTNVPVVFSRILDIHAGVRAVVISSSIQMTSLRYRKFLK